MRHDSAMDHSGCRLQRREYSDYQPVFMLLNSLEIVDEATRRDFVCIKGPVWARYTQATRRLRGGRRLTVVFLSNEDNQFESLVFVGCDFQRAGARHCRTLWIHPDWQVDDRAAVQLCIGLRGRSVVLPSSVPGLQPVSPDHHPQRMHPPVAMPITARRSTAAVH